MMPKDGIDGAFTRLYEWWVDLMFRWTMWLHRVYAKYLPQYIIVVWAATYVQYYIAVVFFLGAALQISLLGITSGNPFISARFIAVPLTAALASVTAYLESKRVMWVLSRFNKSLGPMFRRRLRKITKLPKDPLDEVLNELNGVLDRFLVKVEQSGLTVGEARAVLRSVMDGPQ